MKFLFTIVVYILTTISSLQAQESPATLAPLLDLYDQIKNALVNSDAPMAAAKAKEFTNVINNIDKKTLPANDLKAFIPAEKKLAAGAGQIAAGKDINKQREYFADLSLNFLALIKTVRLSEQPVYIAYCPMKKAYWISNEAYIKNPYYGKVMLTCGNITDTITP